MWARMHPRNGALRTFEVKVTPQRGTVTLSSSDGVHGVTLQHVVDGLVFFGMLALVLRGLQAACRKQWLTKTDGSSANGVQL